MPRRDTGPVRCVLMIGNAEIVVPLENVSLTVYQGTVSIAGNLPCSPEAAKVAQALVLATAPAGEEGPG